MITLKNIDEFDSHFDGDMESFAQAIAKNIEQKSFEDTPLPSRFKEIMDMNWISFGHLITLEKMLGSKIDNDKKIELLAPILIRPASEEFLDNEDSSKEKKHFEEVKELPIGSVYGCFNRFMEMRNKYLFETYNGVIYGILDEDSEDDDEDDGVVASSGVSARQFHTKKFFWYSLIGTVCDGDIFRRQAAIELPMYEVMPFLAEKRSSQIVENLEQKARR